MASSVPVAGAEGGKGEGMGAGGKGEGVRGGGDGVKADSDTSEGVNMEGGKSDVLEGGRIDVSGGGGGLGVVRMDDCGYVQGVVMGKGGEVEFSAQDGDDIPARKKTTSFKITNVFLSRPPSNDGDESAEDLDDMDDSHTEENFSITELRNQNFQNINLVIELISFYMTLSLGVTNHSNW